MWTIRFHTQTMYWELQDPDLQSPLLVGQPTGRFTSDNQQLTKLEQS